MNKSSEKIPYKLIINGKAAGNESLPNSISTMIIE
jgi:hypothetical protein